MGSDISQLSGLKIERQPVEVTDFWTQHQATVSDSTRHFSLKSDGSVSIFKGEAVLGPLWTSSTPLEKYTNNLMKYRHPYIIRYISSWKQNATFHLATEYVQPLSHVLVDQTPLQICVGLNNILTALVFLHEHAKMSHNNVSISAIYVTEDGQWKLGGLQYLFGFSDLSPSYLKHARIHRYDKAVDPSEDAHEDNSTVDQYAFAVLVKEAFHRCSDDQVPYLDDFKSYCEEDLQHQNVSKRPKLSEVLKHDFFNHDFIMIYKFLNFLPLKSESEKSDFFKNVLNKLSSYDEVTVAKQFSGPLLSRLALLDETARIHVLPHLLKPKIENSPANDNMGFFSLDTFKDNVKPRILHLFAVRDSQIRRLLLLHFSKFVNVFSHEELSQSVLPELLLGIKDTDDALVAATLVCLSELVPILGADAVVGGKRSKLFSDGRPNSKPKPLLYDKANDFTESNTLNELLNCKVLPPSAMFDHLKERPPPVGGEAEDEEITPNRNINASEDEWSDWENNERSLDAKTNIKIADNTLHFLDKNIKADSTPPYTQETNKSTPNNNLLHKAAIDAKKKIIDIDDLDIKNQKYDSNKKDDGIDFFADMEPVIEKPKVVDIVADENSEIGRKFNFEPNEDDEVGWDEESWNE